MEVGQKVKVIRAYQPWMRRFQKKVGVVVEVRQVQPSKRVKDGLIYYVLFNMIDRSTGKLGVKKSFITKELTAVE